MAIITVDTDGVSGDFASLSAAVASLPATLTEDVTITCAASTGAADTTVVDTRTITTNGFTLLITAAAGHEAVMPWDASRYRLEVSASGATVIFLADRVVLQKLQVRNSASGNGTTTVFMDPGATCDRVFSRAGAGFSSASQCFKGTDYAPSLAFTCLSCVAWNDEIGGVSGGYVLSGSVNAHIKNCTAIGGDRGFIFNRTSHIAKNCVAFDQVTAGFSNSSAWDAAANFNGSWDTSAPGTNSLQSIADPFVDLAGGDFHRTDTSALVDAGEDLSADATDPVTVDFDSLTWSAPWDIGATSTATGSAAGGGAAVSRSAPASIEWLESPSRSRNASAEVLVSGSASKMARIEWLQPVSRSRATSLEWTAPASSVSRSVAASVEWLESISRSRDASLEWTAPAGSVSRSVAASIEWLEAIARNRVGSAEVMESVSASAGTPLEVLVGWSASLSAELEWLQAASRTSATSLEWLASVSRSRAASVEWTAPAGAVSHAVAASVEWLEAVSVSRDASAEALVPASRWAFASFEFLQSASRDRDISLAFMGVAGSKPDIESPLAFAWMLNPHALTWSVTRGAFMWDANPRRMDWS